MSERLLAAEPAFRDEDDGIASDAIAWLCGDDADFAPQTDDGGED